MIYSLFSLIGIIIGILIAYLSKEELESGKKYFIILEILIILALIITIFFFEFNIIFFSLGLALGLLIIKEYLYFGIILFSGVFNNNVQFLNTALVFLYGMPYSSMIFYKKEFKDIIWNGILFLLCASLLFVNFKFLINFASGGLVIIAIRKTLSL